MIARLRSLVAGLFSRHRVESEMDEEIRFHLECRAADLERQGHPPEEAARLARVEFGGIEGMKEDRRAARGLRVLDEARGDLRFALRSFRRAPGLAAVVVLTLAIVIGVGGLGFSLVDALMLRPLPLPAPERLVSLYTSDYGGQILGGSSYPDFLDYQAAIGPTARVVAESRVEAGVQTGAQVEPVAGALVSPGYFEALGVQPMLGRLPPADASEPTVLLGERLWRRGFGADPALVGATVRLNGRFFTVAGIIPERFGGITLDAKDFWAPVADADALAGARAALSDRGDRRFMLMARLAPGAQLGQLRSRLEVAAVRLARAEPASWRDYRGSPRRASAFFEVDARRAGLGLSALGLIGMVGLAALGLVAAACVNLVCAQLARAATRTREMAIRLALGAGRGRILRQLLVESALLALAGAALGVALVPIATRGALGLVPSERPNLELTIGWRLVALGAASAAVAVLVFGLTPALHMLRIALRPALNGETGGRGLLRGPQGVLIVVQMALCTALGGGAAMLGLSLWSDHGAAELDAAHVLTVALSVTPTGMDSATAVARTTELVQRLSAVPGVTETSVSWLVPRTGSRLTVGVARDGTPDREVPSLDVNVVGPEFFHLLRVPVLAGREFTAADRAGAPPVALVSRALAERLWPGASPLGRRIRHGLGDQTVEVVGVVPDGLLTGVRTDRPMLFLSAGQYYTPDPHLLLRTRVPAGRLTGAVMDALRRGAGDLPVREVVPLAEAIRRSRVAERAIGRVAGTLAALQLMLALAGLSAVVRLYVARRTPEIGVRMALGARAGDILHLVARHGMRLAGVGLGAGLVLAIALCVLVGRAMPATAGTGPVALAVTVLTLLVATAIALILPARRALAIAPSSALRHDG